MVMESARANLFGQGARIRTTKAPWTGRASPFAARSSSLRYHPGRRGLDALAPFVFGHRRPSALMRLSASWSASSTPWSRSCSACWMSMVSVSRGCKACRTVNWILCGRSSRYTVPQEDVQPRVGALLSPRQRRHALRATLRRRRPAPVRAGVSRRGHHADVSTRWRAVFRLTTHRPAGARVRVGCPVTRLPSTLHESGRYPFGAMEYPASPAGRFCGAMSRPGSPLGSPPPGTRHCVGDLTERRQRPARNAVPPARSKPPRFTRTEAAPATEFLARRCRPFW